MLPSGNALKMLILAGSRYHPALNKQESVMTKLEEIVKRQKQGAKFVLSFQMLGMDVETFDTVAQTWIEHGGPGFEAAGVPFRKVIDGEFLIARLTVVKTAEE